MTGENYVTQHVDKLDSPIKVNIFIDNEQCNGKFCSGYKTMESNSYNNTRNSTPVVSDVDRNRRATPPLRNAGLMHIHSVNSDTGSSSAPNSPNGSSKSARHLGFHRRSHTNVNASATSFNDVEYSSQSNGHTNNQTCSNDPVHEPTHGLCCHVEVHNNFNVSDLSEMENIQENSNPNIWLHVSTVVTDECNFSTG